MKSCISDAALFYKQLRNTLERMCATYVYDTLHADSNDYQKLTKKTEERFKCKVRKWDKVQFAVQKIEKHDNMVVTHQKCCIPKFNKPTYK